MCNLHWGYTFCTGVTLELHCSQPIRIEYFLMCIIKPDMTHNVLIAEILLASNIR